MAPFSRITFAFVPAMMMAGTILSQGTILSFTVQPPLPTTRDTVRLLARCSFTSGGCNPDTISVARNGNDFAVTARHCLGPLAVICSRTDTVVLAPLPAGVYTCAFALQTGPAPAPCSSKQTDTRSLTFTVVPATGTETPEPELPCSLAWHPPYLQVHCDQTGRFPLLLRVFDSQGRCLASQKIEHTGAQVPVSTRGLFIAVLTGNGLRVVEKIIGE